jgi:glycosyltransferase involved in cell wall biosynthesis
VNVLICHERFLFRFGADRVLIMLGHGFKRLGHDVTVMAARCDRSIVDAFASRTIEVPADLGDYLHRNELTATWLRDTWHRHFDDATKPDLVLVGGWPFVSAITFLVTVCPRVAFVDFGVVPPEGYPPASRANLDKLRELRRRHLPDASLIIAISDFIARTQSQPDAQGRAAVRATLLGADHMDMSLWPAERLQAANARGTGLKRLRSLKRAGRQTMLCLGRWEPGCYKNSEAALDVLARVTLQYPGCALLILSAEGDAAIPAPLHQSIVPIGFPDDGDLLEIMRGVDLGISPSLWEGFNLPLAEMQWQNRPALVFDLAAHPEVVAHPFYLCRDVAQMAAKACELLAGRGPGRHVRARAIEAFRENFTWDRVIEDYCSALMPARPARAPRRIGPRGEARAWRLIIDVSHAVRDPANSGVIRVTRRLGHTLQRHEDPLFVVWDAHRACHVMPTRSELEQLGAFQGPALTEGQPLSRGADERTPLETILPCGAEAPRWLLLPEVIHENDFAGIRRAARALGLNVAAIFYDAIPVLRPDLCNEDARSHHHAYMLGLAACDLVVPISQFSADCLRRFWADTNRAGTEVVTNALPGEFGGSDRRPHPARPASDTVAILCVSTLEPRKNHRALIRACGLMKANHPELKWSLTLVGNRYQDADDLAHEIEGAAAQDPSIRWLGVADDAVVRQLYQEADFTVYPSLIEGFGMPILESLWHATPCICHHDGAMGELAAAGGCMVVDMTDAEALAGAIYTLSTDDGLRARLRAQAIARDIKTWDTYVVDLLRSLGTSPTAGPTGEWPMSQSERLAITALLSRLQPGCSIAVGSHEGASLSLIARYSGTVFSIGPDGSRGSSASSPSNVVFLGGPAHEVLPRLLGALDRAARPPEFMLLDAVPAGIERAVACLRDYVPKRPLLVMLRHGGNPGDGRGLREAGWERSPYLHWLDEDTVPALAYFAPFTRTGEPSRGVSTQRLFDIANSSRASAVHMME